VLAQSHAALGWTIGTLWPGSTRRLRNWCVAASVLPDVDAATYLFGVNAYKDWHHVLGHNVAGGVLCAAAAAWHCRKEGARSALAAGVLVALCFGLHLLSDMKLSDWGVALAWPWSRRIYELHPNYGIGEPVNLWIVGVAYVIWIPLALWRGVTPLDVISPRFDAFFLNLFRRKTASCATCGNGCNNACDACAKPVCLRHARLRRGFRVRCPACP
jgi:membrane-bound metal-dependent hydrolase YbcI (DUF457 family)